LRRCAAARILVMQSMYLAAKEKRRISVG